MTFRTWLFDLDGTLTVPMHDFASLKRDLGLPPDLDVLAGIATRPEAEQPALHEAVHDWEAAHLARAAPAPHAVDLLRKLGARGCPTGIVTRNTHATARHTLENIGLSHFFGDEVLYGRDDAPAKPDPAAINALLARFEAPATSAVMIGDDIHDLNAATAAGVTAVWLDPDRTGRFAEAADHVIATLGATFEWIAD